MNYILRSAVAVFLNLILNDYLSLCRYDCPYEWGELIPTLMNAIRSDDHVVQHRAILCLHHVVKSLSSKRLAGDRRMFQELCSTVFSYVYAFWDNQTQMFFLKVTHFRIYLNAKLQRPTRDLWPYSND